MLVSVGMLWHPSTARAAFHGFDWTGEAGAEEGGVSEAKDEAIDGAVVEAGKDEAASGGGVTSKGKVGAGGAGARTTAVLPTVLIPPYLVAIEGTIPT